MKIYGQWVKSGVALAAATFFLSGKTPAQVPTVGIAATQPATWEPLPNVSIIPAEFTISRNQAGDQPLVVLVQFLGSAVAGSDCEPLPSSVTIAAGALSARVHVIALSDSNASEGEENVVGTLKPPPPGADPAYTLDPQNWAEVIISDGPPVPMPPLVTISDGTLSPELCGANRSCPGISFRLTRTEPGLDQPLTVLLRYEGSATPEVDYYGLPAAVTFAAGATTALINSVAIDDTLVESDETIVAMIADPPLVTPPALPDYRHRNSSDSATAVIRDNDGLLTIPVVTIAADGMTAEPSPVFVVAPVRVTLSRTGPLDSPLNVGLRTGGTATSGVDYPAIPSPFVIPAGEAATTFYLTALDDALPEGPEIVEIAIQPIIEGWTGYVVGDSGSVHAVISDDDEGAPTERFDIVKPAHDAVFPSGVPAIDIRALAISTRGEIDHPAQFYANGVLIGESQPEQHGSPSIPYLPRAHDIVWPQPADGRYALTARVEFPLNQWLETPPVHVNVGPAQQRPVVSILATGRIAEEDSAPTMRPFILRGEFTISRTGPNTNAQTVYLHVSGTAVSGSDYKPLPFAVSIPAGSASATVQVEAIADNFSETLETVIAEVSNCPPDLILPPCFDFEVDPARLRDTVFIRDDGITLATLDLTAPQEGAHFSMGDGIAIQCTAIDIDGAITAIDFYAGNEKIGESRLFFVVEPPPGSPILHSFTWTDAPAGTPTVTARTTASSGISIVSKPVGISVGDNRVPAVQIARPVNGAEFPSGESIEITAHATDPDGYTRAAEFFADGHKLGELVLDFLVPPPPGGTQTYSFAWHDASPGSHAVSVRVRDDDGTYAPSAPAYISVSVADGLPVVSVRPADPFAVEPVDGFPPNTATFRLIRHGSGGPSLAVNYVLGGSATNGTDYQSLNGTAVFPAGSPTVDVVVTPLADTLDEARETVRLTVVPQFDDGPERYHVGTRDRAIVLIADPAWHLLDPTDHSCSAVGLGLYHLRFPSAAAAAAAYRIEATSDFALWETVHENSPVDNAIHFVDPDTPGLPRRFYRMTENVEAGGP